MGSVTERRVFGVFAPAKVNRFCIDRSRFRKPITQMTIPELQEIKKQFEALAHKEKQS